MENFFKSLPQWALVSLILVAGIIFFYIVMPPHTVCDSQAQVFKTSQTPFLFLDSKKSYIKTLGIGKARDICKRGNNHGACREIFDGLKKMMLDLKVVPEECNPKMSNMSEVKDAIMSSIQLFVRLAWSEKAPQSAYEKIGWFDSSHLRVYCALKNFALEFYGPDAWSEFVMGTLPQLPQYTELGREEAWPRTLFSINCDQYR